MAIDTRAVFCQAYNNVHGVIPDYGQFLEACTLLARQAATIPADITQNALNNSRGAWYAWVVAIEAIKFSTRTRDSNLLVKLPNITQLDFTTLYTPDIQDLVQDFKNKLQLIGSVNLISSNPDYVIINRRLANSTIPSLAIPLSPETLNTIDVWYGSFTSRCSLDDIVAYVGAKVSLRPDRRIQLLHEGSLIKAIYAHLQTRKWLINPNGVKYYAISSNLSPADLNGLRSVATHSIASANSRPLPAVDNAFRVNNATSIEAFLTTALA
jgi:hypothetical protein